MLQFQISTEVSSHHFSTLLVINCCTNFGEPRDAPKCGLPSVVMLMLVSPKIVFALLFMVGLFCDEPCFKRVGKVAILWPWTS